MGLYNNTIGRPRTTTRDCQIRELLQDDDFWGVVEAVDRRRRDNRVWDMHVDQNNGDVLFEMLDDVVMIPELDGSHRADGGRR